MAFALAHRRGGYFDAANAQRESGISLTPEESAHFKSLDLIYRSLCAILYNYVPMSGHPGGSISSGRIAASLLFETAEYDVSRPERDDADIVAYAAGHKALGLYALWAIRDEILRFVAHDLLPKDERRRLRLEDLLGFRKSPEGRLPLATALGSKALDGHPTPATPFVRIATGASGVGLSASIGLALAARDTYGPNAPRVHVIEGEGGLTPGRVAEALAAAGTASLGNLVLHVDWNQASIDSERVCRDGSLPGDYVSWNPVELALFHDWNAILVEDGFDFDEVLAAQRLASRIDNGQPTAIVYRTVKGWRYGIEGKASHGAGHALCSTGFHHALEPLLGGREVRLPACSGPEARRCEGPHGAEVMETCLWEALQVLRSEIMRRDAMVRHMADRVRHRLRRLDQRERRPRDGAPQIERLYESARKGQASIPERLEMAPGSATTLRDALGKALGLLNEESRGALFIAAADLLGSTSVAQGAKGFPPGFYNALSNPDARLFSSGGICEDAMSGICSGLGSFGRHIGVASSYAAFIAPLGHVAARLHAIGNQARRSVDGEPFRPMILVCAHAGLKTGEDGPTHADPQALQLVQENFPPGAAITLTPWEPAEVWPLLAAALTRRPALIAPFVTRPPERVPDRPALRLAPATAARAGVYRLRTPNGAPDLVLVLQESAVTLAFVQDVLPRLDRDGIDAEVYYVSSAELFDALSAEERERIFPEERARVAMGITGFTLPTMYRWILSERGRGGTLHPYRIGGFLGSGPGHAVLAEAGLDGDAQYRAIRQHLDVTARTR